MMGRTDPPKDVPCPWCGYPMERVEGIERTERDGTWYLYRCDNCCYENGIKVPRRTD